MFADVEDFVRDEILPRGQAFDSDKGQQTFRHFKTGALIAQRPHTWKTIDGVSPEEHTALEDEYTSFLRFYRRLPWKLHLTFITCSLGACVQGWAQTGIVAANQQWPFDLDFPRCEDDPWRFYWLFGLVNGAMYFSASVLGTWAADPLNNSLRLGRRGAIFVSAVISLLSVIGAACAQTWPQLLVCRFLLGISIGVKASTVPLLMAENSAKQIRGSLVLGWQMFDSFGIFLAYSSNLILNNVYGNLAWRLQVGSAMLPTLALLVLVYLCPESPRWYIKQGKFADAYKSACALRNTDLQAARDIYFIHKQIDVENRYLEQKYRQSEGADAVRKESYALRFRELFTIPRIWRATVAANILMLAQQLCGINILSFFSATLFSSAFSTSANSCPTPGVNIDALWYGWGTGLTNFLFTFFAIRNIDIHGRRKLVLWTFPNMAWALLATGLSTLNPDPKTKEGLFIAFSIIFVMFYAVGEGPVPFTYSAEAFPLSHRGTLPSIPAPRPTFSTLFPPITPHPFPLT